MEEEVSFGLENYLLLKGKTEIKKNL